jgi:hypothetical protein
MLLSQYRKPDGPIQVVARDGTEAYEVRTGATLYALALDCAERGTGLRDRINALGVGACVDLE